LISSLGCLAFPVHNFSTIGTDSVLAFKFRQDRRRILRKKRSRSLADSRTIVQYLQRNTIIGPFQYVSKIFGRPNIYFLSLTKLNATVCCLRITTSRAESPRRPQLYANRRAQRRRTARRPSRRSQDSVPARLIRVTI
jgi:hypothetical protein